MKWTYEEISALLQSLLAPDGTDPAKQKKRLRIIQAAAELFTTQGYRKTGVEQIADRAAMAKGTVYLYFPSKAHLLLAAVALEKKQYLERFPHIFHPRRPPAERLRLWLRHALVAASEMPLVSRILQQDPDLLHAIAEVEAERKEDWEALQLDVLSEMIDLAARPHSLSHPDIADRARVLLGLIHFSCLLADGRVRGGLPLDRFVTLFADMLVDGLAHPSHAPGTHGETEPPSSCGSAP